MLRHIVMFKKKPDTDEATVREIMARLESLTTQIPELHTLRCHRALPSDRPVAYTFLLDSTVADSEALAAYLIHPAHITVNEWMSPFLESRAVVDYEE